MAHPLMPKATAVWLVENTALTFEQIATFCGLHELEVQAIADDEVAVGMQGLDPISGGELAQEELERCAGDPSAQLEMAKPNIPIPKARSKGARYTPVSKRQDRPDAIAWLVRSHPELTDAQISKLIGTTKPTINAVRERTHWNMPNIKPQNPAALGLCAAADLEKVVTLARAKAGTVQESPAKPLDDAAEPSAPEAPRPGDAAPATAEEAPAAAIKFPAPGESLLLKGKAREEAEIRAAKEAAALKLAGPATTLEGEAAARAERLDSTSPNAPTTPEVLRAAEAIFAPPPSETPATEEEAAPTDETEATPDPDAGEPSEEDAEKAPDPSPETSPEDNEK